MNYSDVQRLEAAEWFFDIHDAEDPSAELLQEWIRWLDASEGNRRAFEAVESAYHQVKPLVPKAAHGRQFDGYDATVSVIDWRTTRSHRTMRQRWYAVAAGVAVLAVASWLYYQTHALPLTSSGEFATGTNEQLPLTLADGSRVELGARSRLEIIFSAQTRDVRLIAGEAFFQVHKDANRPFRVHALEGVITAVGTAFNVRTAADHVTVAVSEGVVSVTDTAAAPAASTTLSVNSDTQQTGNVRLSKGEELTFSERPAAKGPARHTVTRIDPTQTARWREGWLVYHDELLRDVVADVNRYSDREIIVSDSVPDNLRYTGVVSRNSVIEWLEALPEVFPVAIEEQGHRLSVTTAGHRMATSQH
jgi:transmembrane sensor